MRATTYLAETRGPLAIEVSSAARAIRITDTQGRRFVTSTIDEAKELLAAAAAVNRRLWAADAAEQAKAHRAFLADLGMPRIWCARTVDRALVPARAKPTPAGGQQLAVLMTAHSAADPLAKRHAIEVEAEDWLWRNVADRGFRVDRPRLAQLRQEFDNHVAAFARNFGLDLRRGDEAAAGWLTARSVGFERTDDMGWSAPNACDISAMPSVYGEDWAAYKWAHSALKRARLLRGVGRELSPEGRVHPVFRTNSAATGRMSVAAPGMQSIPVELRGVFLAEPDHDLVGVDHSGAELRVLARLLGDKGFTRRVMGGDPYADLAAATGQSRSAEKWRLLAWVYGQTTASLGRKVGAEQAQTTHDAIVRLFPEVVEWRAEQTTRALRGEQLRTLAGRPMPNLGPKRRQLGLAANLLVQGSARDAFGTGIRAAAADGLDLWLPIHDELFVLAPKGGTAGVAERLVRAMTVDLGAGVTLSGAAQVYHHRWGK